MGERRKYIPECRSKVEYKSSGQSTHTLGLAPPPHHHRRQHHAPCHGLAVCARKKHVLSAPQLDEQHQPCALVCVNAIMLLFFLPTRRVRSVFVIFLTHTHTHTLLLRLFLSRFLCTTRTIPPLRGASNDDGSTSAKSTSKQAPHLRRCAYVVNEYMHTRVLAPLGRTVFILAGCSVLSSCQHRKCR